MTTIDPEKFIERVRSALLRPPPVGCSRSKEWRRIAQAEPRITHAWLLAFAYKRIKDPGFSRTVWLGEQLNCKLSEVPDDSA